MTKFTAYFHGRLGSDPVEAPRILVLLAAMILALAVVGCQPDKPAEQKDMEASEADPKPTPTETDPTPAPPEPDQEPKPPVDEKQPALPGDDKVLARVDGSPITQYDVELSLRTTLGNRAAKMLDDRGRKKVLDSLVASRAIAREQEKKLTDLEKAVFKRKVAAIREQLLVKMHLARNTPVKPPTREMVEDYYRENQEQFGARTMRRYEIIGSDGPLTGAMRDKMLAALKAPGEVEDWAALAKRLRREGLPARHRAGQSDLKVLRPRLRDLMRPLKPGETSPPTFIDGEVMVARITSETRIPPRPLTEVAAEIRNILMPAQYKEAAKQASDQVLKQVKVEYMTEF